jgi:uridine kinase
VPQARSASCSRPIGASDRQPSLTGPRSAIAVDGLDGSGKSLFAANLAAGLRAGGRPAVVIRVDDFRRALDFAALEPVEESSLYYDQYFDFLAANATLTVELAGPEDGTVIIVEGVMVLRADLPVGTPLILLDVGLDEARRRIVARDQAKGRTPAEIARRIDRRYFPAHLRYCAAFDPHRRADLIVDNEDWANPSALWRRDDRFLPEITSLLDRLLPRRKVPGGTIVG